MCFQSGPAIAYHDEIRSFTITVHEKRWNTIASAIEEVNKLEPALKSHWNLAQFLGKENSCTDDVTNSGVPTARPGETEISQEYGVNLRVVDDALSSDFLGCFESALASRCCPTASSSVCEWLCMPQ